jgi:hypothetical protein
VAFLVVAGICREMRWPGFRAAILVRSGPPWASASILGGRRLPHEAAGEDEVDASPQPTQRHPNRRPCGSGTPSRSSRFSPGQSNPPPSSSRLTVRSNSRTDPAALGEPSHPWSACSPLCLPWLPPGSKSRQSWIGRLVTCSRTQTGAPFLMKQTDRQNPLRGGRVVE